MNINCFNSNKISCLGPRKKSQSALLPIIDKARIYGVHIVSHHVQQRCQCTVCPLYYGCLSSQINFSFTVFNSLFIIICLSINMYFRQHSIDDYHDLIYFNISKVLDGTKEMTSSEHL